MSSRWRRCLTCLVATASLLVWAADAAGAAAAGHLVQVHTRITIHNPSQEAVEHLAVTLPATVSDHMGQQRVLDVTYVTPSAASRETTAGTGVIYRVPEVEAGDTLVFEEVYLVQLPTGLPAAAPEDEGRYLEAEPGIESDHPAIREASAIAVAGIEPLERRAEALVRAVVDRLTYDWSGSTLGLGALAGFERTTGVCQAYASLFVAMARAAGIPARLVYGWADPGGLEGELSYRNRHVWAEYYDPDRGWVPVDPTFAERQADPLFFDPAAHLAQDLVNRSLTASYTGRGLVSIAVEQRVSAVEQGRWPSAEPAAEPVAEAAASEPNL